MYIYIHIYIVNNDTVYHLLSVANLDLSILPFVKMKILEIVYRLAVAEGKLMKPTVAEARFRILCSGRRQRREK